MTPRQWLRALVVWTSIVPLAIVNGTLREWLLSPVFGTLALPLSGCLLAALILLVAWLGAPWLALRRDRDAWRVGGAWAGLTVSFELLLGRFLLERTWTELAGAYDPRDGNLWLLVVAMTFLAPCLARRLRG